MSDYVPAKACLARVPKAGVIADKGYDSDDLRKFIRACGANPVIPPRKNRKKKGRYSKEIYKIRNRVERFFCRIKGFRRVATRYDRHPYTFMAPVFLASIVAFWLLKL